MENAFNMGSSSRPSPSSFLVSSASDLPCRRYILVLVMQVVTVVAIYIDFPTLCHTSLGTRQSKHTFKIFFNPDHSWGMHLEVLQTLNLIAPVCTWVDSAYLFYINNNEFPVIFNAAVVGHEDTNKTTKFTLYVSPTYLLAPWPHPGHTPCFCVGGGLFF